MISFFADRETFVIHMFDSKKVLSSSHETSLSKAKFYYLRQYANKSDQAVLVHPNNETSFEATTPLFFSLPKGYIVKDTLVLLDDSNGCVQYLRLSQRLDESFDLVWER